MKVSASSMIRKLSMASITSSLARRSPSFNNMISPGPREDMLGTEIDCRPVHDPRTQRDGSPHGSSEDDFRDQIASNLTPRVLSSRRTAPNVSARSRSLGAGNEGGLAPHASVEVEGIATVESVDFKPMRAKSPSALTRTKSIQGFTRCFGYLNH